MPKAEAVKKRVSNRNVMYDMMTPIFLILSISIPIYACLHSHVLSTWQIWWYGWITAVSTGFGALPLMITQGHNESWLGLGNAIACGMMLVCSCTLMWEGVNLSADTFQEQLEGSPRLMKILFIHNIARTMWGVIIGFIFIIVSKRYIDQFEDVTVFQLSGLDARKAMLIMGVMTLHSFSEGVSIGVSFGGETGLSRGQFISTALALHNIPEGLAIALVLGPRGFGTLQAALFAVFSSLPQPIMAVPSFLFVEFARCFLPVGLGFAGGAMIWVTFTELYTEAQEILGTTHTRIMIVISALFAYALQSLITSAQITG